ncbi:hypothetical protein BVRB_9g221570 [Beta vulgaris subsp. vulgaris]|nr:hypothetical protein BVRB_9g221570 [Beta vulgaris subsp. vulgaris]
MLLSTIVLDYSSGYLSTGGFLVVMTAVIALAVSMFHIWFFQKCL